MSKSYKVYAPIDVNLDAVQYMKVSDSCADVFLRKNVEKSIVNAEFEDIAEQEMNIADELYFQVDPSAVSKEDITNNFEKYWLYGEQWVDKRNLSYIEKIECLESKNAELNQCILALCAMV